MKLLCSESDTDICNEIVARLAAVGIAAEVRQRSPSLFDEDTGVDSDASHEIWVVNDEDAEKARDMLYPDSDASSPLV